MAPSFFFDCLSLHLPSSLGPGRPPQVVRLAGVGVEWKFDFSPAAGGCVSGEQRFEHGSTVFAGHERLLVVLHTIDKMRELLGKAVVPELFDHREAPAARGTSLLDSIVIAGIAIGEDRI